MYIETERMIIRDFRLEDEADLHEILGDEETSEKGSAKFRGTCIPFIYLRFHQRIFHLGHLAI